jgi:hypothetical protein
VEGKGLKKGEIVVKLLGTGTMLNDVTKETEYFINLGLYTLLTCCILICLVCIVVYCLVYLVVVVLGLLLLCCTMGVLLLSYVNYVRIAVYVLIAVYVRIAVLFRCRTAG